jgi:hypothetical protein
VGLYGEFGSGRIVLTGPDQDFHSHRGSTSEFEKNQYRLLLNTIRWVSKRVPAGSTGARPTFDAGARSVRDQSQAAIEAARKQTELLERIRAKQNLRVNKGSN